MQQTDCCYILLTSRINRGKYTILLCRVNGTLMEKVYMHMYLFFLHFARTRQHYDRHHIHTIRSHKDKHLLADRAIIFFFSRKKAQRKSYSFRMCLVTYNFFFRKEKVSKSVTHVTLFVVISIPYSMRSPCAATVSIEYDVPYSK